jgi:hypothetical protein
MVSFSGGATTILNIGSAGFFAMHVSKWQNMDFFMAWKLEWSPQEI